MTACSVSAPHFPTYLMIVTWLSLKYCLYHIRSFVLGVGQLDRCPKQHTPSLTRAGAAAVGGGLGLN